MNNAKPASIDPRFLDFTHYEQLKAKPHLLNSMIKTYQDIFSEPEVWNESYSYQDVRQKLKKELQGPACLRLCVDQKGTVIAFCWAQLLTPEEVSEAIHSVQFIQSQGDLGIEPELESLIGSEPVVYLQDLGIRREHRGSVPLMDLIVPVLEAVCQIAGTRKLFFWSVSQTCVAWLAQKADIDIALRIGDVQLFAGDMPPVSLCWDPFKHAIHG